MLAAAAPGDTTSSSFPGAISADFSQLEKELGAKIRLGPKHAVDLGFVLRHIEEV